MSRFAYTLRYFANDMIPMILFLVLFLTTKDIMLATGFAIAVGVGQMAYALGRRRPIGALQWASLALVAGEFLGDLRRLHGRGRVLVRLDDDAVEEVSFLGVGRGGPLDGGGSGWG